MLLLLRSAVHRRCKVHRAAVARHTAECSGGCRVWRAVPYGQWYRLWGMSMFFAIDGAILRLQGSVVDWLIEHSLFLHGV
jgi:hypothetical protein